MKVDLKSNLAIWCENESNSKSVPKPQYSRYIETFSIAIQSACISQMSAVNTEVIINVEGTELTLLGVKKYDLVLYNFLIVDHATYFCKVVQGDEVIMLAAWTVQVRQGTFKSL